jgi:predicted ribosomally synthesized peptide with SipW-like signal peptide
MEDGMRGVKRKLLLTLVILGLVASVAAYGTYSAFTATTTNSGNSFATGTVVISQHAGSTTLYTGTNKKPADPAVACVRVTYTGSLDSTVKLYASVGITNGTIFNLKVERGSGITSPDNTMNCTGFTASTTAYDGAIGSLGTTFAGGVTGKAAGATWVTNDSVDYRFTITVNDDTTPNAHTSATGTGSHSFTWEAQNT